MVVGVCNRMPRCTSQASLKRVQISAKCAHKRCCAAMVVSSNVRRWWWIRWWRVCGDAREGCAAMGTRTAFRLCRCVKSARGGAAAARGVKRSATMTWRSKTPSIKVWKQSMVDSYVVVGEPLASFDRVKWSSWLWVWMICGYVRSVDMCVWIYSPQSAIDVDGMVQGVTYQKADPLQ